MAEINGPSRDTLSALETAPNMYLILSPDLYILTASDLYLQVKKMRTMINGFLNISRLESVKIQINSRPLTLAN